MFIATQRQQAIRRQQARGQTQLSSESCDWPNCTAKTLNNPRDLASMKAMTYVLPPYPGRNAWVYVTRMRFCDKLLGAVVPHVLK
jgi:hypothetical protein